MTGNYESKDGPALQLTYIYSCSELIPIAMWHVAFSRGVNTIKIEHTAALIQTTSVSHVFWKRWLHRLSFSINKQTLGLNTNTNGIVVSFKLVLT